MCQLNAQHRELLGGCRDQKFGETGKITENLGAERCLVAGKAPGSLLGLKALQDAGQEQAIECNPTCCWLVACPALGHIWGEGGLSPELLWV